MYKYVTLVDIIILIILTVVLSDYQYSLFVNSTVYFILCRPNSFLSFFTFV